MHMIYESHVFLTIIFNLQHQTVKKSQLKWEIPRHPWRGQEPQAPKLSSSIQAEPVDPKIVDQDLGKDAI